MEPSDPNLKWLSQFQATRRERRAAMPLKEPPVQRMSMSQTQREMVLLFLSLADPKFPRPTLRTVLKARRMPHALLRRAHQVSEQLRSMLQGKTPTEQEREYLRAALGGAYSLYSQEGKK